MLVKSTSDVLVSDYPFHDSLKDELVSVLENYEDQQNRTSNVKATMTGWNITSPQIERLKKYVSNEIDKSLPYCIKMVNAGQPALKLIWKDFWGNVYHKGDYAKVHNHSPAMCSFVYFLKTKWYNSPLIFKEFGERVRPKEGKFVVFPGHIRHHVPKHRYNETRMTLSGNLFYDQVCTHTWIGDPKNDIKIA